MSSFDIVTFSRSENKERPILACIHTYIHIVV